MVFAPYVAKTFDRYPTFDQNIWSSYPLFEKKEKNIWSSHPTFCKPLQLKLKHPWYTGLCNSEKKEIIIVIKVIIRFVLKVIIRFFPIKILI